MSVGEASVCVSIVPLLFLYYSSIVPLVLGPRGETSPAPRHCLAPLSQLAAGSGAAFDPGPAEGAKDKLAGQSANQSVFGRSHPAARPAVPIIVAEEMQHPVYDIADQFALPSGMETAGLGNRFVQANEDFAVQTGLSRWFRVVEGYDVGRALMLQESLVEPGHLGRGNQVNAQIKASIGLRVPEQRLRDSSQVAQVHAPSAVAVAKSESAAHAASLG